MSLPGVKMGFKVTQLSGVYHVFLRTKLFLSTHFRSHVSPRRSQGNWEVPGLEGPRQVSQESNTFYSYYVECCWRKDNNHPMSGTCSIVSCLISKHFGWYTVEHQRS